MIHPSPIPIYLIRHAEAAKSWGEDPDPGLSETGHQQAANLAKRLNQELNLLDFQVWSSPLLRARETAVALKKYHTFSPTIVPGFAEIPSPMDMSLAKRSDWLRGIFSKRISELSEPLLRWRSDMISALASIEQPTLIFSHFMVLNTLVGYLQQSNKMVSFKPGYCEVMKIEKQAQSFQLISKGTDEETFVN